jgi:hypothetical protein
MGEKQAPEGWMASCTVERLRLKCECKGEQGEVR